MTQDMQAAALSTYDRAIAKGRLEGKIEGKIEGKLEGKIEGKIEQSKLVAKRLLTTCPEWTDPRIARMSGLSVPEVKHLRLELARKTKPAVPKQKP
jgi:predicted transposase YdaD